MSEKPIVLCLGDSHTFGTHGASWVRELETAFPGLKFMNTGVNGTQVKNVHSRLDRLISGVRERLAGVTLLIGTNDCLRSLAQDAKDYWGQQYYQLNNGDTGPANINTFNTQYRELIAALAVRLRQRAAAATDSRPITLMIITLPPIGEDLNDKANRRVDEYNAIIHAATVEQQQQKEEAQDSNTAGCAGGSSLRVVLLDLNITCKAAITRAFGGTGGMADDGNCGAAAPTAVLPRRLLTPFWRSALTITACLLRRYVFGISYGCQSDVAGTVILTPDCIHLNEAGARLLARLVEGELCAQAPTETIATATATAKVTTS
ncbi:hypothetical protein Vretimale_7760 [Volvox reticuliferus]|uniref:SGNH hydrolase-type esterase domain-containing protein n=1 Tax=Volvox reticuliferus TaxID=1737510 RepID=A0A8J4C5H6_9CHLO|nr:hypothetical protein Vretifemale_4948 [Volvox reticuliferus]GIM02967.1 hypothetical protein Vretimale_7760 [Volvox reticuliferus]